MDAILFSLNESSLNFCKPIFQGADNSANQDRFYAVNALPTNWETISNSHLINRVEVRLLVRLTRAFFVLFFVHPRRPRVKIHGRAFVSCSRVKACNFSGFVNISSETFLEKLSPLNELRNYGDRWGKLRRVRKHQSHPAAPDGQKKIFRSGQFKRFWNWFGKSKVPRGSSRSYSKLSPRTFHRRD